MTTLGKSTEFVEWNEMEGIQCQASKQVSKKETKIHVTLVLASQVT